jgi:hypothetical protein
MTCASAALLPSALTHCSLGVARYEDDQRRQGGGERLKEKG